MTQKHKRVALSIIATAFITTFSVADSVNLGTNSYAGTNASAIGVDANASATGSVVDGYSSTATGAYGVTIGYDSANAGQDAILIGRVGTITSAATDAIGLGRNVSISNTYGIGIGYGTTVTGSYGLAGAYSAKVLADYGIAIGYNAQIASGAQASTVIGANTYASGDHAFSGGYGAQARGIRTILIGTYNGSAGQNSVLYGTDSIGLGQTVQDNGSARNVLIGKNLTVNSGVSDSVLFGNGYSETESNVFNVGGKRIKNVGTPTAATDATTKAYVDTADTSTLTSAKSYTDIAIASVNSIDMSAYYDKATVDTNIATAKSSAVADSKTYTDSSIGSATSNFYDKTASDARFASKSDTYTKSQVDSAISSVSAVDLSAYETVTNVDSKVLTAKNDAIATADSHTTTALGNYYDKSTVDSNFYSKSASDATFATKTDTYTKSQVDSAISASVGGVDLSSYEKSANVDTKVATAKTDAVNTAKTYTDTTTTATLNSAKNYTDSLASTIYDKATVDTNIAIAKSSAITDSKTYTDSSISSATSNFYDKTVSDTRFASKSDTYTKSQVDSAISAVSAVDLSAYETVTNIDSKVLTAKNDAITSSKSYADTQDTTMLNSAKSYVDSNFYNKSYIDTNIYTKAQTYSKTEVDAIVSGVSGTDVSGFYTKTDVNTMFVNYYDRSAIDTRFSNYLSTVAVQTLITTAKAEAITAAQTASGLAQANAVALSKTYTDSAIANLTTTAGTADKTYVDTSVSTAKTSATADANTYTDAKTASTLADAKAYTDTQVTTMGAKITQEQAAALSASTESVSLTKTSSITGNVHGITVYDDKTTISGGTTSTQMTLNDDTVDFKHIQTGDAVRLTGVADGINDTDAANVRQVNTARDEAIASSNAYTDQEVAVAKKEASQGTALAIALATPMSFHNGNNAMNIGTGYYKGEKAISVKLGKKVDDSMYYTVGVATAGNDTVAAQASVGWSW